MAKLHGIGTESTSNLGGGTVVVWWPLSGRRGGVWEGGFRSSSESVPYLNGRETTGS